ncbi:HlyD family efflux transporter periplasmic adaptor subunit [Ulvibacterium sp.]|uniref:efflux RND transporter periplasmic adaptor subunit n=1 Tax=Ulvibacterium sp. TaxID=2665914 RepID=UPI00262987EF|nr:HlyD family efflux transporter periplasmic adaptor subunit [Ulvibacterium sp.]
MKGAYGVIFGIVLTGLGVLVFIFLLRGREEPVSLEEVDQVFVSTILVATEELPFVIEATGTLAAKNKIELFSEVQGILLPTTPGFREGNTFYRGENLLRIDGGEHNAQLQSKKSALVNQIVAMLPDMEIEFPEASGKWRTYLENFNMDGPLEPLPKTVSNAEKFFVTGKNIVQTYYDVKNLQERLSKYDIRAPFTGIVTQSDVYVGTLVRSGQKLGEFIDPSVFELQLAIPATANKYMKVGKKVHLISLDGDQDHVGRISRINGRVDQETQTVGVVVEVSGKQLKEGQYLKAEIFGEPVSDVLKIEGGLLVENDHVYIIRDSLLRLQKVVPLNYVGDSVVVRGLEKDMVLLDEIVANAYPGMKVTY